MSASKFGDEFQQKNEKAFRLQKSVLTNLRTKQTLGESENALKADAELRKLFQELEAEIGKMDKLVQDYERNPLQHNITIKEVERRRKMVDEYKNQYASSFHEFSKSSKILSTPKKDDSDKKKNLFENVKKEYELDLTSMNKQELKSTQETLLKNQDDHIENLLNTVGGIGSKAKVIKTELETDMKLLGDLEFHVDKNVNRMEKTTKSLDNLLKKTSNTCLFICILVQIIIFIMLIAL